MHIVDLISHINQGTFICTVRFIAVMAIAPFASKQSLTGMGRNTAMFALELILVPMVLPMVPIQAPSAAQCVGLACKEAIIGLMLGFLGSFFFYAIQSMGALIDLQRGASMGAIFDPALGEQASITGTLLTQMALALFFISGAFYSFMTLIYESYNLWPIYAPFPELPRTFPLFFLKTLDEMMMIMLSFAGPLVFVMFLAEIGLGFITRFAPQLNVFFLAMPIKSALSVFFLVLYMSILAKFFQDQFLYNNNILEFFMVFFK